MRRLTAAVLMMALLLMGCGVSAPETTAPVQTTVPETTVPETTVPPTTEAPDPAELLLASMTLRQKVGQLFLVRPEALAGERTEVSDATLTALEQ